MNILITHPTTSLILFNENLKWRQNTMATEQKNLTEGNAKHVYEYLQLINGAETESKRVDLLKKWGNNLAFRMLLTLNFHKDVNLDLPPGTPPYNRDEQTHPDLMTPIAGQIQRLKACVKSSNLKKMIKERTFIQVLEMIAPKEADVLVACKDKALHELYPNVTKELVASVFPEYVSE